MANAETRPQPNDEAQPPPGNEQRNLRLKQGGKWDIEDGLAHQTDDHRQTGRRDDPGQGPADDRQWEDSDTQDRHSFNGHADDRSVPLNESFPSQRDDKARLRRHYDSDGQCRSPTSDADTERERRQSAGRDERKDDRDEGDRGSGGQQGSHRRWPLYVLAALTIVAIIGGIGYWWLTRNEQSTDDAYTEGNAVSFASQVTGYVTELHVNDNTFVHKGDLLLRIDQRTYIAARDQAQAALDLARAQLSSAQVSLEITRVSAPASLMQAKAQLLQADANRNNAQREFNRQKSVDPRATTQNNIDQANFQFRANDAAVQAAQAQVDTASVVQQNIQAAEDTVKQRQAQVEQAEANLESAQVNLSYTELRAPEDGYITRRNVDLGTFLQAGQQVFYIVTPHVWVVANFKETQLGRMRPGQQVSISVDAYPNLKLRGHVDSIQQGSGARFSAFPAENATGNFVKIVRRVPVKIMIDSGLPQGVNVLPFGISVEPTVDLE